MFDRAGHIHHIEPAFKALACLLDHIIQKRFHNFLAFYKLSVAGQIRELLHGFIIADPSLDVVKDRKILINIAAFCKLLRLPSEYPIHLIFLDAPDPYDGGEQAMLSVLSTP